MSSFFFFNDTATTEIYTLSLHDALPISRQTVLMKVGVEVLRRAYRIVEHRIVDLEATNFIRIDRQAVPDILDPQRSEEHTSELQSRQYLVCRLLLEKKKKKTLLTPSTLS